MKASFCETEKVLHSARQQMLEKRSDDEMKSFKICLNRQMAILRKKCSAMESDFVKKVSFCTNFLENCLEKIMQEIGQPILKKVKPWSISSTKEMEKD